MEQDKAKYILDEVHEGICGDHSGPRSLVGKIVKASYFWPTMQKEAKEFVKNATNTKGMGMSNKYQGR